MVSENFVAFLEDTFEKLRNKDIGLLRSDSGFYCIEVFDYLEQREHPVNYITAVRFYEPIQKILANNQAWITVEDGIEISEVLYQGSQWNKARRMIIVRQNINRRPKAAGKTLKLFQDEEYYRQYRYSAYITNLTLSPVEVWRLYRGRGDSEKRIKELKYDFGFESFNLKSFWGTEIALIFAMIAYNLMSIFRQFILNSKVQHTLSKLRYKIFAIGAYFKKQNDKYILKLSLNMKRREWFTGLWTQYSKVTLPFTFSNA